MSDELDPIVNCHAHVFTYKHVPNRFYPKRLMELASKKPARRLLGYAAKILAPVLPGITPPEVKRVIRYIVMTYSKCGPDGTGQEKLFLELCQYYPRDTRFVLLSMDMAHMGAGTPKEEFSKQLETLAKIKSEWKEKVYPFVAVDPRRENHLAIVKDHIETKGFAGVKLYPPLGYWPCDPRLTRRDGLYAYCEEKGIPIITHASPPTSVLFHKINTGDPYPANAHPITNKVFNNDRIKNGKYLTNPDEFRYVLKQYPKIKLCFAHFGGDKEWEKYLSRPWSDDPKNEEAKKSDDDMSKYVDENWVGKIRSLITDKDYPNVYADISYTWALPRFTPLLKLLLHNNAIRPRVLFGTDFYMVENVVTEREASIKFRYDLGEEDFTQIARINPKSFLSP